MINIQSHQTNTDHKTTEDFKPQFVDATNFDEQQIKEVLEGDTPI